MQTLLGTLMELNFGIYIYTIIYFLPEELNEWLNIGQFESFCYGSYTYRNIFLRWDTTEISLEKNCLYLFERRFDDTQFKKIEFLQTFICVVCQNVNTFSKTFNCVFS